MAVDSENTTVLIAVLVFGVVALLATAFVRMTKKEFDVYFVKLFGLLFIGTLAVAIVFVKLDSEARTGAYTILGTIAGYLAGSKVPPDDGKKIEDHPTPPPPPEQQG